MDRNELARAIEEAGHRRDLPGGPRRVLSMNAVHSLSERYGIRPREVEAAALDVSTVPERYARNLNSIGLEAQKRLLESSVVQVGLGGLGGHLLDMLVRAGVGRITAFDGDTFEASNLNRQLLSSEARLGRSKTEAALEHVLAVNSSTEIDVRKEFVDARALAEALAGRDLLLDALGALGDRKMLVEASTRAGVPLVTTAVAGRTAWVSTVFPGEEGPTELMTEAGSGGDAQDALGCPAPIVAAAAGIQASEALGLLAGEEPSLRGKMLIIDLATMSFETMAFKPQA